MRVCIFVYVRAGVCVCLSVFTKKHQQRIRRGGRALPEPPGASCTRVCSRVCVCVCGCVRVFECLYKIPISNVYEEVAVLFRSHQVRHARVCVFAFMCVCWCWCMCMCVRVFTCVVFSCVLGYVYVCSHACAHVSLYLLSPCWTLTHTPPFRGTYARSKPAVIFLVVDLFNPPAITSSFTLYSLLSPLTYLGSTDLLDCGCLRSSSHSFQLYSLLTPNVSRLHPSTPLHPPHQSCCVCVCVCV